MNFSRPDTLIAKLKYIIGLMLSIVMLVSPAIGNAVTTDKLNFEASPKLTTESTAVVFKLTNNSRYGIDREIGIEKLEKKENENWVELSFDEALNEYPAIAYTYPNACIFPTETVELSTSCKALFGHETAPAGTYRITFACHVKYGGSEKSLIPCEFTVA